MVQQQSNEDQHDYMQNDWTDEDIENAVTSVALLLITFALTYYILVVRPFRAAQQNNGSEATRNVNNTQSNRQNPLHAGLGPGSGGANPQSVSTRRQQHEGNGSNTGASSTRVIDGIVPFSTIRAQREQPEVKQDMIEAESLLKNLSSFSRKPTPHKRGSVVVVTIRQNEFEDANAIRFLYLLGCVTNLFVILSFSSESLTDKTKFSGSLKEVEDEVSVIKERMVELGLHKSIVPTHRIIACKSSVGRIAFVRQLSPEWVLDYDSSVRDQLARFGFHVLLYGEDGAKVTDMSAIGNKNDVVAYDKLCDFLSEKVEK
mmetsp:Transcript_17293/g.25344  ORF Transcript_17293/g.25344 Transcript_17293/m.25344 type:complete len:316 (-) Transcript_17293:418-1365(-)|eukprot:CAMPEP_0195524070 /NCGR_PEP_ID=MMETSP0794_2-20130614/23709_1 /TAXON_ID=515487 /ORGANISM="Stephanopyxis turris, Strain CCMP 815" /LENGTH=315 /DNA_ID=CAMNT_0040654217 /DNA_START=247 /DNA_END=1194 /DNA_ORIENTATION=+